MQKKACLTLTLCAVGLASLACQGKSSKNAAAIQSIEESDSQVKLAYDASFGLFESLEGLRPAELEGLKTEFTNCSEVGRKSNNASLVFNCAKTFDQELSVLLSSSIHDLAQKNEARRSNLDEALILTEPTHEPIKKGLADVWGQYEVCHKKSAAEVDARKKAAQLKGCEVTIDLQLKGVEQRMKAIDVNILDTF